MRTRAWLVSLALVIPDFSSAAFDGSRLREGRWFGNPGNLLGSYSRAVDLDHDGLDEWIGVGTEGWSVWAFDPNSRRLQPILLREHVRAGTGNVDDFLVEDVDGDGDLELLVLWFDSDLQTWDPRSGALIATRQLFASLGRRSIVLADADPAPGLELIVGHSNLIEAYALGQSAPLWMLTLSERVENLWVGEIDGDPEPELLVGTSFNGVGLVVDLAGRKLDWVWPQGFREGLVIGDLDGDAVGEILTLSLDGKVRAIDGRSRAERWSRLPISGEQWRSILDADRDGAAEVVVVTDRKLTRIDPLTGNVLATHALQARYPDTAAQLGELDGDCMPELFWLSYYPPGLRVASAGDFVEEPGLVVQREVYTGLTLADLDGNGCLEAWQGRKEWLSPASTEAVAVQIDLCTARAAEAFRLPAFHSPAPSPLLVTRGSRVDVVVSGGASGAETLSAVDAASGQVRWKSIPLDGIIHSLAAGDVDGDGLPEVAAAYSTGSRCDLRLFSSADGAPLSRVALGSGSDVRGLWMGDLDGDGSSEVVGAFGDGIAVHAGLDLAPIGGVAVPGLTAFHAADIDGDGDPELLVGDAAGHLRGIDLPGLGVLFDVAASSEPIAAVNATDLDGDGRPELVGAERLPPRNSEAARTFVLSGNDRVRRWTGPVLSADGYRPPDLAVADVDRDGNVEILITTRFGIAEFEYPAGAVDAVEPVFLPGGLLARGDVETGCCPVIRLTWPEAVDASSPPCRYRIYRASTPGFSPDPTNLLLDTPLLAGLDRSVAAGETWYYAVQAVDRAGNEGQALPEAYASAPTGDVVPQDQGNVLRALRRQLDVVLRFDGRSAAQVRVHRGTSPDRATRPVLSGTLPLPEFVDAGAVSTSGTRYYDVRGISACSGVSGP